ncbi:MAG: hypothetical protein HY898_34060 [Deltaproteobacteria bacterium]|nr:hypothetical protein [Deltaproteobacteria bacterium]
MSLSTRYERGLGYRFVLLAWVVAAGCALAACGSDDASSPGGEPGGSGGDAGAGGVGGAGGSAGSGGQTQGGSGGTGGAGGSAGQSAGGSAGTAGSGGATSTNSSIPGASFEFTKEGDAQDVVLVSSNFLQKPSGGQYYQEWIGEVKNTGTKLLCHIQATVSLQTGTGQELAKLDGFANAPPYYSGTGSLMTPCAGPGVSGGLYSNNFGPSEVPLANVAKIVVTLGASVYPNMTPATAAPTIAAQPAEVYGTGSGYWALKGKATATQSISNLSLKTFPYGPTGLLTGQLGATNLNGMAAGSSWDFESTAVQTKFTQWMVFADFMTSSGGNAYLMPPGWQTNDAKRKLSNQTIRERALWHNASTSRGVTLDPR